MSSDRAWLEAHRYPLPTTDADEFVAGMVKAHEGDGGQEERYLMANIRDMAVAILADDSGATPAVRGKVWGMVRRIDSHMAREVMARVAPVPAQHFEVLNEWDPQP